MSVSNRFLRLCSFSLVTNVRSEFILLFHQMINRHIECIGNSFHGLDGWIRGCSGLDLAQGKQVDTSFFSQFFLRHVLLFTVSANVCPDRTHDSKALLITTTRISPKTPVVKPRVQKPTAPEIGFKSTAIAN